MKIIYDRKIVKNLSKKWYFNNNDYYKREKEVRKRKGLP